MFRFNVPILFLVLSFFVVFGNCSKKYRLKFKSGRTRTGAGGGCEDNVPTKYHYSHTSRYCEIVAERIRNGTRTPGSDVQAVIAKECNRAPIISCWCRKTCKTCEGFDITNSQKLPCSALANHTRVDPSGNTKNGCQIYPVLRQYCPDSCESGREVTCDGMGTPEPIH